MPCCYLKPKPPNKLSGWYEPTVRFHEPASPFKILFVSYLLHIFLTKHCHRWISSFQMADSYASMSSLPRAVKQCPPKRIYEATYNKKPPEFRRFLRLSLRIIWHLARGSRWLRTAVLWRNLVVHLCLCGALLSLRIAHTT